MELRTWNFNFLQKIVDTSLEIWDIGDTHGNKQTKKQNMRTKILLASAAALVAGIVASNAQVYSANVVGYVNTVLPGNGQYTLICNPLDDGNGNHLTNIISAPLPGGIGQSQVAYYSGGPQTINKTASGWGADHQFPPGTGAGFYVRNGKPGGNAPTLTNTFVGTVVVLTGGSITNDIPAGYSLNGSAIPYAGNLAVSGTSGGDANLNYGGVISSVGIGKNSQIIQWDTVNQVPDTYNKPASGTWGVTVPVAVGQGFWIFNYNADTNVVQNAVW